MGRIIGIGGYVPQKVITNDMLSEMMDTSDEWIVKRTGIRERRFASEDEYTSDLAVAAGMRALSDAGVEISSIDLMVVATCTGDRTFPSTACIVADKLGANRAVCFDVAAACSGFVYAMEIVNAMLSSGRYKRALVVGADRFSSFFDVNQRSTSVLFGDGAGAFVIERAAQASSDQNSNLYLIDTCLYSDAERVCDLYTSAGPAMGGSIGSIVMDGASVFKHAVSNMSAAVSELLHRNSLVADDVDLFVPHQANLRILDAVASSLGVDASKFLVTLNKHANTSAASVPLACFEERERLNHSKRIIFVAMGAGFTWGAALLERRN